MNRFHASTLLTAAIAGVISLSAPVMSTPLAEATVTCPPNQQVDARTGLCWGKQDMNNLGTARGMGGTAPCMPGRLGLCLGAIANGVTPGDTLRTKPPAGPAPRTTWPSR